MKVDRSVQGVANYEIIVYTDYGVTCSYSDGHTSSFTTEVFIALFMDDLCYGATIEPTPTDILQALKRSLNG